MDKEDTRVFKEIISFFLTLLVSIRLNTESISSLFGRKTYFKQKNLNKCNRVSLPPAHIQSLTFRE